MSLAVKITRTIYKWQWLIVLVTILTTLACLHAATKLTVSTKLEALMPEEAASVKTLNAAMEKAGSFSSIQVVVRGDNERKIEHVLFILEAVTRPLLWSESVQYFEDISILERHKLLQLPVSDLEHVEASMEAELLAATAREFEKATGIELSINLMDSGISSSSAPHNTKKVELDQSMETEQKFVSDDGKTRALIIWPKPGYEGLGEAKKMISDITAIIQALELNAPDSGIRVGIAGRIRNKVAQFDAVVSDLAVGLGSSVGLIVLLLLIYYRRFSAIVLIITPLIIGIIWTIGLTSLVIGGLNLITIFLALILFGLGIDFGIHNFSRYLEARTNGDDHLTALADVIGHTGKASLMAGLTTAAGFLSLLFTEFRAFREFGFIAGSGIVLIFASMYVVFPAFLGIIEPHIRWPQAARKTLNSPTIPSFLFNWKSLLLLIPLLIWASMLAPHISFEKNFKNIQAARSLDHIWATEQSNSIFKGGHDRAVLVVQTLEEVKAIEEYFAEYAARDTGTPTIAKITSIRNFVPDVTEQQARLAIINRMWTKLEESGPLPSDLADKTKYLQIDTLDATDLPPAMRRVFLGDENEPGYLMYIYNSVTMDDADLARQFYDDAARFKVNGITYYPASEGFIFVEMLALMKADAARAVTLVSLTTLILVFAFTRSISGTFIILLPTAAGLLLTLGAMSFIHLPLSIINMVILPSLIGLSVDNGIHIYNRYKEGHTSVVHVMATTGRAASITTLTTLIGFGGLITASMGGLRSMGWLALIGFSFCLFMTWTLLPTLLRLQSGRQSHVTTKTAKEQLI